MSEDEKRPATADHALQRGALTDLAIAVGGAATWDAVKAGAHQVKDKIGDHQGENNPKKT